MVKYFLVIVLSFCTYLCQAQNLSMGVGARVSQNVIDSREQFNFDILNVYGDTLILKPLDNGITLNSFLSVPIYMRYTSKHNWWAQINYGYEVWRLQVNGTSQPSEHFVNTMINSLQGVYTEEDIEDLREVFTENALINIQTFERVEYNKFSFSAGSTLNRKGIIKFYYGFGFDFYTPSTWETYQGLIYNNDAVELQHELLEDMPKLESFIASPFINIGLEKQNLRMGLDLTYYSFPAFGEHVPSKFNTTIDNNFDSQLIKRMVSVGVSVNYTLFNQNFNQAISADKKNVLDPLIIGRYSQKPKLIQLGLAFNMPSIYNVGWSVIDDFELPKERDLNYYTQLLDKKGDKYLSGTLFDNEIDENDKKENYFEILDYLYLEKKDTTLFQNSNDIIDTNFTSTTIFLDWGNINSILITPKISGFVRINPHENFSGDFNIGYQNHNYGIVAYETESSTKDNVTTRSTRKLLYQENFHEISLGMNAYVQKNINNISQLGFHVGINYNLWLNGRFIREIGGINDSELLEDFHDYYTGKQEGGDDDDDDDDENDETEEWNSNENVEADKGVFTKEDYYNYTYNNQNSANSYHMDFEPYLFNTIKKRSFVDLRFGVDYYIENLKFNFYMERSIGRSQTMYNNLFSAGIGVALFLN